VLIATVFRPRATRWFSGGRRRPVRLTVDGRTVRVDADAGVRIPVRPGAHDVVAAASGGDAPAGAVPRGAVGRRIEVESACAVIVVVRLSYSGRRVDSIVAFP
jgi:hypothetical protein